MIEMKQMELIDMLPLQGAHWMRWCWEPKAMFNILPLPEGNGKGYCPDQNGNIRWQERYPLPSALAFDRAHSEV